MSSINSQSTVDDMLAAYLDNLSYATDSSTAKARAFQEACRALLIKIPAVVKAGNRSEVHMDVTQIQKELANVQRWLATSGSATPGGGIIGVDFTNFR